VPTDSPPTMTLRDRKKIKLRNTILDVATRLFLSRGYDRTTLEQVCEEAETSLRTLLRYFPTKEDLALGREIAATQGFTAALAALDRKAPVIQFWRERVATGAGRMDLKSLLKRLKMFDTAPAVSAKVLALQVEYEDLLADAFAREAGLDPDEDIYGRLLAGMLIAGHRAAARKWVASNGKLDLVELRLEVVDWALAHFPPRPHAIKSAPRPVGRAARVSA
jgi:AcrR family transcriptional regulator